VSSLLQDLRYALRMLAKRPGLTAVAVVTLALGIGANTVIFTGVYYVLLQDLPFPQADRLVVISQAGKQGAETGVSYPDFADWKAQGDIYSQMAAARTVTMTLAGREEAERVVGGFISADLLPMLAGRASLGRTFSDAEFRPGSAGVVLLGDAFWQRRLGADPGVIGRRLTLDAREFTVIGVMPPAFAYPFRAELWLPLDSSENAEILRDATSTPYEILARLKPGVTLDRAARATELLARRSREARVVGPTELAVRVEKLRDTLPSIARYGRSLLVLQLAVTFVLLIACLNLANLLLARNAERHQEFTVRLTLGGSPGRLTRLLLVESLLLGLLGASLGLLLAQWGLHVLRAAITWRPAGLPEAGLNAPVLLVTLSVALMTSLAFGLAPALLASRLDLNEHLKSAAGRTTSDAHGRRLTKALVVAQVALAVVLLASASTMTRTLMDLARHDPGFETERAALLSLTAPPTRGTSQESLAPYFDETLRRIRAVPGVEAVGGISYLPLVGYNPGAGVEIEGRSTGSSELAPRASYQRITPEYFKAMGIPVLSGRPFADADMKARTQAVIVNYALANRFWPGTEPLGKRLRLRNDRTTPGTLTVVGVVGDLRPFGPDAGPSPELYLPLYRATMTLVIRTASSPSALVPAIRAAVRGQAQGEAAFELTTMPQRMADSRVKRGVFAWLLGAMAGVALLLTALGIYGLISHQTARRTREMGVRMALGARDRDVFGLVVRQGMTLASAGVLCGLVAACAMMRVMRTLPFRLSATDPWLFAGVGLLVAGVALLACYLPARRAAKVDPMVALRCE
jgi:putative ABC transport system permease protein